ncbi:MAG: RNA-binding protein [Cenarchaeum sp. SB0665_bin_23]|nr:RNA-binding protein [Cenarchaeum sp. SB0665_bin_23]MYG32870.1 RNA-binding protein [Cenarchaeum sp. SB0677_bin_16]
MMFAKTITVPSDRIGVIIGKAGGTKRAIEESCGVSVTINSQTGEVNIESASDDVMSVQPFKATNIVLAMARGFSVSNAMLLMDDSYRLHVINLQEYVGKSSGALGRIRGRVIGENGRARRNLEQLGQSRISVYGKTVSIIAKEDRMRTVIAAIHSILSGSMHAAAYVKLEAANRQSRLDRMALWEGQSVS